MNAQNTHADAHESGRSQVRKGLLRQIFSGSSMHRWNDKLRPCPLAEIDKQAHKMIVAALLLARASRTRTDGEFLALAETVIEGALFDYLFRTVVTDIKPPIFYRIRENEAQYARLVDYVTAELEPVLSPMGGFWDRFRAWHADRDEGSPARLLLSAAHQFASQWEFRLIRPLNDFDPEMPVIERDFERRLSALAERVDGMAEIMDPGTAVSRFAGFCGQLRFQVRWTQIPRIPQTDVLGHMFFVGTASYLFSLAAGACRARRVNNFFGGLFHDLPELLTRDIISPVKKSSESIARLIRDCEREELASRVFGPLDEAGEVEFTARLRYYLGLGADSEFCERVQPAGGAFTEIASYEELDARHNRDEENPLDGALVKACDTVSAFLEADYSVRNGISSSY
ncbi:MAG: HD domain-containing protein, partial [Desulfovibrionaceae bacterium]|nr:HD domain-containing protein [Desulfovibrionaceae bacterium]